MGPNAGCRCATAQWTWPAMTSHPSEQNPADASPPGDDATAATAPKDCCTPLQEQLDAAQAELAKLREDVLRERADLENQRRRVVRDVENARRFANERVLGDLLPVVDSLEAGLGTAADSAATPTWRAARTVGRSRHG